MAQGWFRRFSPEELLKRFWKQVAFSGKGCWTWLGLLTADGYGTWPAAKRYFKDRLAHRLSYRFNVGEIPKGKLVLHTCDNPACVNPAHLYVGTDADNTRDKIERGRHARGTRIWLARLNPEKVKEIRSRREEGPRALARAFGVTHGTINAILSGRTWKEYC